MARNVERAKEEEVAFCFPQVNELAPAFGTQMKRGGKGKNPTKRNRETYSFSIDPDLWEKARENAKNQRLSLSRYMEIALAQKIEKDEG